MPAATAAPENDTRLEDVAMPQELRAKRRDAGSFQERKARRLAEVLQTFSLDSMECDFERHVLGPAKKDSDIDPAKNFLEHKTTYDTSKLLKLLRGMPKGAVLHTHGIASGSFDQLVDMIRLDGHFFVWQGPEDNLPRGSIKVFSPLQEAEKGWAKASVISRDELYRFLTLTPGLPSVEACWEEFGKIWERIRGVASCAPFYFGRENFLWKILEQQLAANVLYVEIKEPLFMPWMEYDGRVLSDDEWVLRFVETVKEFKADHPGFQGARLVLTALKDRPASDIRLAYQRSARLKAAYPDFVAGFDLAGPEDKFQPIDTFAQVLEEEVAAATKQGIDLPLLLHAGETNLAHAQQIFDAVVLACKRIGHGFALARFPTLLQEVVEKGIAIECCPISNQVLGYCPNLSTHAGLGLLRSGVKMVISPDDPGMWHYSDVAYDFAAVTVAWNLGVAELKALARNSILCSTLGTEEQEKALEVWSASWNEWIREAVSSTKTS